MRMSPPPLGAHCIATSQVAFCQACKDISICDKKPAEALKSSGQDARRAGAEREKAKEAGQEGEGKTSPRSSGLTAYEKIVL